MVVEWPLVHWSHVGCYGQQHGWFYVNDDDDDVCNVCGISVSRHLLQAAAWDAILIPGWLVVAGGRG